ncbi:hypothetical protein GNF80_12060 [Clostridium perfringens]|nr:hypothetical protein [Clostridium perfringens]
MKKVYKESQLVELKNLQSEVIENIRETISVLDENYGVDRDIEADLGGYIFIAENIVDIEMLKQDKLKSLIPEYTDVIKCKEGVKWTYSLFLLSSDYAIVVVTTE